MKGVIAVILSDPPLKKEKQTQFTMVYILDT